MGGFAEDRVRKELKIPDDYDIIAMVAVGKRGKTEELAPDFQAVEQPGIRRPLKETMLSVKSFRS
jgi:hypothetical protein